MATAPTGTIAPTVGSIRAGLDTERSGLLSGGDLSTEADNIIKEQLNTLEIAMGGSGATAKDGLKALSIMSNVGASELSEARKRQSERVRNERIDNAVSAVDLNTTTATESAKFTTLTSAEQTTARARLAQDLIKKFASSTDDVSKLMADLDAHRAAGKISVETVEEVKKALNERVAGLAKSIQLDLDAGILTPSGLEARLNTINNSALRDLVGAKFGETLNSTKYSTEADGYLTPASGTPTTTAALDAALSTRPPAEAIGIRKALNEKVSKKANEYRQLIATGHRTIEQVSTEINAMPDSVQKDLLLKNFAAEFSSNKMKGMLDNPTFVDPITGVGEIARLVTEIQGSPEFSALPAYVRIAYEKALTAKMSQAEGTSNYYTLKHNQQEAERRLADQRLSEIARKQLVRDIKNYYLPAALMVVGVIGGGIAGGTIGEGGHILTGMLLGTAPGGIWLGGNIIAHGWDRTHRREAEAKMAEYRVQSQEAYNNIHNIDAERELMPVRYLNEIVKVAAEVSWATQGANSGLTREEYIKRYMEDAGIRGLGMMADTMMKMNLMGNVAVTPAPAAPK